MIDRAIRPFVLLSFALVYAAGVITYGVRIAGHALGASGSTMAIAALMVASAMHGNPWAILGGLACVAGTVALRHAAYRTLDVKGYARKALRDRTPTWASSFVKSPGVAR